MYSLLQSIIYVRLLGSKFLSFEEKIIFNYVIKIGFYWMILKDPYVTVVNSCYDYGFISAKTNGPYFGIESDMVC